MDKLEDIAHELLSEEREYFKNNYYEEENN
jgi:hypothetical protein